MNVLAFTFIFPLLGFLILAFGRQRLSEQVAAVIGVGSIGMSAMCTLISSVNFLSNYSAGTALSIPLWTWFQVGDFAPGFSLVYDGLSLMMMGVITGVGFFIHLFASWYMRGESGYARFFSYMNLFVASMVLLVLADNLLLMYLGWEGVGICSYLLIGFYYHNRDNGKAAMKAFTVTRVGDVLLAFALFLLYRELGTLNLYEIIERVPQLYQSGDTTLNWIALMLLGGAAGKSAQIPLHTWLADAMAGPTPVSALIHAATMVTAGVYLIARLHPVFILAPDILHFVGIVGAITLLVAGFCALAQTDIKRILAYSTMSQIGYMFVALGVGAWQVAIFHLMTHAFFKALLFLSAGAVIVSAHHEQNIFKMGGLRHTIPFVWVCFLVGGGALAAIPFVTIGFYSKDAILWEAWASGHPPMFWAGVAGAFLTGLYTFRMIWVTFHGEAKTHAEKLSGWSYKIPLAVLLVLSTAIALLFSPANTGVLNGVLPASAGDALALAGNAHDKHTAELIAIVVSLLGIALAVYLYVINDRKWLVRFGRTDFGSGVTYWAHQGFGFDRLFDWLFLKPFLFIGKLLKADPIDKMWLVLPMLASTGNKLTTKMQSGSLRGYVASMGMGMAVLLVLIMARLLMGA